MSSKKSDDDLTRVLDGWSADAGRVKAPTQPQLLLADELDAQVQRAACPDPARSRLPEDLDLNVPTRFSKWDSRDVTDVDAALKPVEAAA